MVVAMANNGYVHPERSKIPPFHSSKERDSPSAVVRTQFCHTVSIGSANLLRGDRMPQPAQQPNGPPSLPGVPQDYWENGRKYHGFRKGKYMFPCDEVGHIS